MTVLLLVVVRRVSLDIQVIKYASVARANMGNSGAQDTHTLRPNLTGRSDHDSTDKN